MRIPAIALLCITTALLTLGTTRDHPACASPLRLEISAGFQGYYRLGDWLPIRVNLENHGPPLPAHLAIPMGTRQFIQSVALPSPTNKRLELYVLPLHAHETLSLAVLASDQIITTSRTTLKRLSETSSLIVALTDDKSNYDFLQHPAEPLSNRHVVYPGPAELPESWKGYEIVEAVILDTPEITTLHPLQRQALKRWLQLGGKLLLVARTPVHGTSALYRDFLTLPGSETRPTLAATSVGLGSLLYTAVSPDATGILTATNRHVAWTAWLGAQPPRPSLSLARLDRQILRQANGRSHTQTYRLQYLGGFFCLYAVAMVGLANRVLARCTNPWRGYATSGGVILAFALLSLLVGFVAHRGTVIVRETTLMHVFPRSPDLYITTSTTLLTPRKQQYHFQTMPATYVHTEATMPLRYAYTDHTFPINFYFSMPMWANSRFFLERYTEQPWFLTTPSGASMTLVNRSPSDLRHCYWLGRQGIFRLPDVPTGQRLGLTPLPTAKVEPFQLGHLPILLRRTLSIYRNATPLMGEPNSVVCSFSGMLPGLRSPSHRLQQEGTTVLIVHLERQVSSEHE